MTRLITLDDFIETYIKLRQRGLKFITSKFNLNALERAKTAFNHENLHSANWWIIPKIKERWHLLITGNENTDIETFIINNYLSNRKNIKMLSLGSGNCYSELKFAEHTIFEEILCTDISNKTLDQAKNEAQSKQLDNLKFEIHDANKFSFPDKHFDIVYFKASLHHFKNIDYIFERIFGTK